MKDLRKGVSLITVLMFMLVATIAGTATYKWLTSEGRSSASRLLMNQARAAAVAGVDAARSWMSSHGNETGAIVQQFFDNMGQPISLNSLLSPMAKESQQFDVYLVGVEFRPASPVYKMKILSKGTVAGRDASYTESAILNVTGLYQMEIPVEKVNVDYHYAYFGGSTNYSGEHHVTSMLINGNWGTSNSKANPGYFDGDFIVTGNAYLSGSNMNIGGTTCIGHDLYVDNGFWGKDLYVHGNTPPADEQNNFFVGQLSGSAYFNGNVKIGQQDNPGFGIAGNVTLNGAMTTNMDGVVHSIQGNLCLGDHAVINMLGTNNQNYNKNWLVQGNVWMPQSKENNDVRGINTAADNHKEKRVFGGTATSNLYIKDAEACTGACPTTSKPTKQKHGSDEATFVTNGTVMTNFPDEPPFECAESVQEYCNEIWETTTNGCDGSSFKVDDLLKKGQFATRAGAAENSSYDVCHGLNEITPDIIQNMNDCWDNLMSNTADRSTYLFNDYLVLNITEYDQDKASGVDGSGATLLNGRFVFIISNLTDNYLRLPKTEATARAFVYLPNGMTHQNGKLYCSSEAVYNYFIFTEGSISEMDGTCTWNGSIYATASNCSRVAKINGSATMSYDPELVNDMVNSGIVCANDGNATIPCPVNVHHEEQEEEGEEENVVDASLYDAAHIATASHLNVTVESEYKSDEGLAVEAANVNPSLLVLPRVVYIHSDAPGRMLDYLSAIPLNGAKLEGAPVLSCPGQANAPPMQGKIKDGAVHKGIFNCTYSQSTQNGDLESNFYVVVSGEAASTPMVHFAGNPSHEFEPGVANETTLSLVVDRSQTPGQVMVTISVTDDLSGWSIVNLDGSAVNWNVGEDGVRHLQVGVTPSANEIKNVPVLKVRTTSSALSGTLRFTLHAPQGCIIGGGTVVKSYNLKGVATVVRGSLSEYCSTYPEQCPANSDYAIAKDLQDCPGVTGTWVRADGVGCDAKVANDRWTCDAAVGAANEIRLVGVSYDQTRCVLHNPETNNYVTNPQDDAANPGGYKLYASLKRKHYTLTVSVKDAKSNSAVDVYVSETLTGNYTKLGSCSSTQGCEYIVYAGMYVSLTPVENGQDYFSYWESNGTYFEQEGNNSATLTFVVQESSSYTAVFNRRDNHCFYTDFSKTGVPCNSNNIDNCVDECNSSLPCDIDGGKYEDAGWLIVNTNKGSSHTPQIKDKYITRPGNGHILMMLNTVQAGPEGSFSSLLFADVIKEQQQNKLSETMNYGVVVRSTKNGSEYISVNVYGVGKKNAEKTHVRVCYLTQVELTESGLDHCQDKLVKTEQGNDFTWNENTPMNFIVDVEGDNLSATLSYVGNGGTVKQGSATFDLKNVVKKEGVTLNDETHQYVGLKLGGTKFGSFNASWHSTTYAKECFADPAVFCSFAAKYIAGEVPLNESVTPIIGYSSWFTNVGASCATNVRYFYNGCDMPESKFDPRAGLSMNVTCRVLGDDGFVENYLNPNGLRLKPNEEFQFGYEGLHGFKHATRTGYVRNASVEVDCKRVNGKTYYSRCGEFYVGQTHSCTQDIIISEGSPNHGLEKYVIDSPILDGMNLRDATVVFDLEMAPGVTVSARFKDASGTESDVVTLSTSGLNEVSYEDFSDEFGFNPEQVASIALTGSGTYSVKSIESHCANALKVRCGPNDASYEGAHWRVRGSIDPPQAAKKCKVESLDGVANTYFGNCNQQGTFLLEDPDFLKRLNEGTDAVQYSFKISVYEEENATVTDEPKSECTAVTQEYRPVQVTCALGGSTTTFVQGAGVPAFVFSAENCPEEGCVYEMVLSNGDAYEHTSKLVESQTWLPSLNMATKLSTGPYFYTGRIYGDPGKTKLLKTCTTPNFEVVEAQPATATSCAIEDGKFSAFVNGTGSADVNTSLIITDALGTIVKTLNSTVAPGGNLAQFNVPNDLAAGYYIFSLHLNGDPGCAEPYSTEGAGSPITVTGCDDVVDQDPTKAISISPTVTGCDKNCSWVVEGGASGNTGSNYTSEKINFYGNEEVENYTLKVKRTVNDYELVGQCSFKVTFAAPAPEITVSCPTVTGQDPSQNISQSPTVSNCNGNCSWTIKKGSTSLNSGNSCSSISFKDANGSGSVNYTFTATCTENGQSDSKNCTIKVTYAGATPITPCHGTTLSAGKYSLTGWSADCSWCGTPTKIKVQSGGGNGANCLSWITGTNKKYGENSNDNCYGNLNVTYPIAIDVPTGHQLTVWCQP